MPGDDISISKTHAAWLAVAFTAVGGVWYGATEFSAFSAHQALDMHGGAREQFEEVKDDLYFAVQELQNDIVSLRLEEARQSAAVEALSRQLARVQSELARIQDLLTGGPDPPNNPFRSWAPDYGEDEE
jgi:hypothetical protein